MSLWGADIGVDTSTRRDRQRLEYGRYLCGERRDCVEVCAPVNTSACWSVPWLSLLPPGSARTVQKIDAALRQACVGRIETECERRRKLQQLRTGTTECAAFNDITRALHSSGEILSHGKLVFWIMCCIVRLHSVARAVQYTYTVLAAQSGDNFMCSIAQVSLYVAALDAVLSEIRDNLPANNNADKIEYYLQNLIAKHNI